MSSFITPARPGLLQGDRPQHWESKALTGIDHKVSQMIRNLRKWDVTEKRFEPVLREIEHVQKLKSENKESVRANVHASLARSLRQDGLQPTLIVEAFALIRLAVNEVFSINPHPEQLYAAWAMLHGCIAEMHTGEGKTLTASFPAIVMAMTGTPVHVITVNDYLAERDSDKLKPLYQYFGLSCSCISATMNDAARKQAYAADIVYCTNKQVVFDYLRDATTLGPDRSRLLGSYRSLLSLKPASPLLRGLGFAVVDEADSVLIDEARVPLILAKPRPSDPKEVVEASVALSIAASLQDKIDYQLTPESFSAHLTDSGLATVCDMTAPLAGVWRVQRYRDELIRQALCALYLYRCDRDYLVHQGQVELIDESTGRVTSDRKLQHGLHRMLELKEKCDVTDTNDVIAGLSFQRFFQRYCHLSGMSGTLKEVRSELSQVYGMRVICVSPHKKIKRIAYPSRVFADQADQLDFAVQEIKRRHQQGQPLLLGTRTVAFSERLSQVLSEHDIAHELLNAREHSTEAQIVAAAGRVGAVTVATNMAGRGTDIALQRGAADRGGLHVINFEVNDSSRVDRQLFGRAARQGDPGSCQSLLCVSDESLVRELPGWIQIYALNTIVRWPRSGQVISRLLIRRAQKQRERRDARQRLAAFHQWPKIERQLGYTGEME